jgi:transcriptional regulator with XRE-family HTH domain
MKTIGEFIAGRRKELSLSQKELVALIKNRDGKPLSMPYLSHLENGRGEPPGVPARPCLAHLPPARVRC